MSELHELPPWDDNTDLIEKHPELHHYTSREGLEGILKSGTLWATHFSYLSDSLELRVLEKPLKEALLALVKPLIVERKKRSAREKFFIVKNGGVAAIAQSFVSEFVDANYGVTFGSEQSTSLAPAFITSLCSHSGDHRYERNNGLLSQWRGYGSGGRFALVFDTRQLDALLSEEWKAHNWITLALAEAVYFDETVILAEKFPNILPNFREAIRSRLEGQIELKAELLASFVQAATRLKHRAFREEREVRIVAIPGLRTINASWEWQVHMEKCSPEKSVCSSPASRKYLALFDNLSEPLPIKRVIVGPGRCQKDDYAFAKSVADGQFEIVLSETPYIG